MELHRWACPLWESLQVLQFQTQESLKKKSQVFKEIFKSTKIMFQTYNSYKNKLISFHIYPNYMFVPMVSKDQRESTGGGGVARKSWCTNKSEGHKVH